MQLHTHSGTWIDSTHCKLRPWDSLTTMVDGTLVTGGLGFIGSTFVRQLASNGVEPIIVDADTYAGDERRLVGREQVRVERLDIADPGFLELVGEVKPRVIVHFAAESHVTRSESDADVFWRTNVEGTRNVLEAALAAGVRRVVHISTDEVYGPCPGDPFREEDKEPGEGLASSAYARSKAVADDLALSYSDRLDVVVARPTNCFGPWQHPEKAVARWTTRALRGERLPVWGDGQQVRDWMFVEDASEAISVLIERGERGGVYNVAPEGSDLANLTIARAIAEAAGLGEDAVYLTAYDRPDHDRRYAVQASKIRALGWSPTVGLEERIAETVGWYRDNEGWWRPLVDDAEGLYRDDTERSSIAR